jgi:hypothetical protein
MSLFDTERLFCVVLGVVLGYGAGRYLWLRYRVALSFWSVIVALVVLGLLTERLFVAIGQGLLWQAAFFPLLVGLGTGVSATSARPPRRAAWWQVWKV